MCSAFYQLHYLNSPVFLHILESETSIFIPEINFEKWIFFLMTLFWEKSPFQILCQNPFSSYPIPHWSWDEEKLFISGWLYVMVMDIPVQL